ncbi:hypothetical protein [Halomonas stenophila]|uniref:Uncharacterized protein n=1 Tax=Halomonas stenophila TaxID=795312 RepID=A0A7W5EV46_9GAMM|nr:hypothetical protein [Halomonas stenophila]MBB3231963.1 hypothetical protein [Halomonas stenophila]
MSRPSDAKAAVSTIHRHLETILDACLQQQGRVYLDESSEKAAHDLIQHNLAFHLDEDDEEVIITRALGDFVHFITQSQRRQVASGEVNDRWNHLKQTVTNYSLAKRKGNTGDIEHFRSLIQESVHHFVDTIRLVTARFSDYVNNDFRSINDIDIKIQENKFAIREAERMNDLFETISYDQLSQLAGADPYLIHLFNKVLSKQIDTLSGEVLDAIHQLKRSLTHLVKKSAEYQRQNRLIDAFLAHYDQNPDFTPSFPADELPPDAFRGVEPLPLKAEPALDDPRQEVVLIEIATKALARVRDDQERDLDRDEKQRDTMTVVDHGTLTTIAHEDPEQRSAREFFEALPELFKARPSASVMAFYQYLDIETTPEIWVLSVLGHYYSMADQDKEHLNMQYETVQVPRYSGNHILMDVIFEHKEVA